MCELLWLKRLLELRVNMEAPMKLYDDNKAFLNIANNLVIFLWGGEALKQKLHLVWWVITCFGKSKEGLSVRHLSSLNTTLLCKWSWCYVVNRGGFLTKSHQRKIWGRGWRVEIPRSEKWVWGWPLESHKEGVRLFEKESGFFCG